MPASRGQKWLLILCRPFVISLVICIAGVMSGEALAKKDPELAVKDRDKNGDGRVGRDEWDGTVDIFTKIDANGDNYLTVNEFSVHIRTLESPNYGKSQKIIQKMDKDGDGKLSRGEWTGQAKFYDQIDANRDKRLTIQELTAHYDSLAGSNGGKKTGGKGTAQKSKSKNPKELIKKMDKDGDGKLSRDEWTGQAKFYDQIDADQDKRLTIAELTAHYESLAGANGGKKTGGKGAAQKTRSKDPEEMIKKMDTDGDGLVARDEWKGQAVDYDKIDANRDARVTLAELTAHIAASANSGGGKKSGGKAKNPKEIIKKMDTDGDGLIAREEWEGEKDKFDQFDADHDSRLTAEELVAGIGAGKDSKVNLMSAIRSFDKNRDSMLSRDEWTGPADQFESTDANQDGQLTVFELATAQVKNMDKDGSGMLSRSETPFPKEKFDNLDKNGDDLVSAKEFSADMGWAKVKK